MTASGERSSRRRLLGGLIGVGLLCLAIALALTAAPVGAATGPKVVELPEFSVIGIQVRTENAKEMTGAGEIPRQWERFFKEAIAEKIPNKASPAIYAVYTGYASDRNGEYDFILGMKVSSVSTVPPGMVAVKVPSGRYAVLTSAKGPAAEVVPQAWQRVYTLESNHQLGGARAFKADFELYDERSQNPQESQVDLYLGLK